MLKPGMMTLGRRCRLPASTRSSRSCRSSSARGYSRGSSPYVISMASHLYVLSKVELSFAYPFLSLAYVAVLVFAYFVIREDINAWRHGRRSPFILRRHRA